MSQCSMLLPMSLEEPQRTSSTSSPPRLPTSLFLAVRLHQHRASTSYQPLKCSILSTELLQTWPQVEWGIKINHTFKNGMLYSWCPPKISCLQSLCNHKFIQKLFEPDIKFCVYPEHQGAETPGEFVAPQQRFDVRLNPLSINKSSNLCIWTSWAMHTLDETQTLRGHPLAEVKLLSFQCQGRYQSSSCGISFSFISCILTRAFIQDCCCVQMHDYPTAVAAIIFCKLLVVPAVAANYYKKHHAGAEMSGKL